MNGVRFVQADKLAEGGGDLKWKMMSLVNDPYLAFS